MILIRHGQSEFNVHYNATGRDPGIPDPALTPLGRQQAADAATHLRTARPEIHRLVASPYRRALQTAEIIADLLDLPLTIEPTVREHAWFQCDIGTPRSLLEQEWPHLDFRDLPEKWWPDLDETDDQVLLRAQGFRASVRDWEDWDRVAVISHWGFIRNLTGQRLQNAEMVAFDPLAD